MENATKALLIAAAVLIAILIISLGVFVYTRASDAVGDLDLSEYEIKQFNEKFTRYEGTNESGADVNALLQTVFNHNNSQPDTSTCVSVSGKATVSSSNALTTTPARVSTGARYTITCNIDAKSKLVTSITVTQNTTTPD